MSDSDTKPWWGRVSQSEYRPELGGRLHLVNQTCQAVYGALCSYSSPEGVSYPSKSTIAAGLGLTDRTVYNALARLCEVGIIGRISKGGGVGKTGAGITSRYRITPPNPEHREQGTQTTGNAGAPNPERGRGLPGTPARVTLNTRSGEETNKRLPKEKRKEHLHSQANAPTFQTEQDREVIRRQHPDLWQAVAICYDADALERNPQTQATACEIVDQIAKHGATPEQVAERWAWLQRNDPAASRTWIGRHWEQVGRHMALGGEPGKRPNARGWALPKPPDDPLFDAIARCHSWQYKRHGKATGPQLEEIAEAQQALEGKGATPEQVRDRYAWMKRNDKRLGLLALIQFWGFAGECLANGTEPGSRKVFHDAGSTW